MIKKNNHALGLLLVVLGIVDRLIKFYALGALGTESFSSQWFFSFVPFINHQYPYFIHQVPFVGVALLVSILVFFLVWAVRLLQQGVFPLFQALILLGALSNLYDLWFLSGVIDWLAVGRTAFLNLSDVFIAFGCGGLLWNLFLTQKKV